LTFIWERLARASDLVDARGRSAAGIPETPDQSRKMLRRSLDNILIMALHKEPDRRYSSAELFRIDLGRGLSRLSDFENCSHVLITARFAGPIEVPIGAEDDASEGVRPVRASRVKVIQCRQRPNRRECEYTRIASAESIGIQMGQNNRNNRD
jgi:hypothetical protein